MRTKILTAAMVILLVAAAFFLPEQLLVWGDRQLLDNLHVESLAEEREGFAESIQLTVPEKIMLLRGGKLTVMELDNPAEDADAADLELYLEETGRLWEDRMSSLQGEVRSLQSMGGLPEVWKTDVLPDYTGHGDLLYLDTDTHMSFQVYQISLQWEDYGLDLLVDQQSGRILTFALQWTQGGSLGWGPRGAARFGSAWRDYWQMDSVSAGWYSTYTRGILENLDIQAFNNSGDYAAHDQISFMYDSQSQSIPLDCQGVWTRNFLLTWNR